MDLAAKYFVLLLVLEVVYSTPSERRHHSAVFLSTTTPNTPSNQMLEVELLITFTTGGMSKQRSRREWHSTHNFSAAPMPIVSI